MILYMYVAPGQGQTPHRGRSFDVNRNVLSLHSFVTSLKKMSLKSDFVQFFNDLIHLFVLRLNVPVNNFSVMLGQIFNTCI